MTDLSKPEDWLKLKQESQAAVLDGVLKQVAGADQLDVLLPYQKRGLKLRASAGSSVMVVEKSRRIGFTWALAADAVLTSSSSRTAKGMDTFYISFSQDMTREFIDACAMWAKAFAIAADAAEEFVFEDQDEHGDTRSIQAFRIRFASGFEIVGLSSAPRSLRGKQGFVIIDEAAFVDSLPELMKAAMALNIWGGKVVVCSTHNGAENPFNEIIHQIHSGKLKYKHMRIDLDDALRDGLYKRICLVKGEEWSPEKEKAWRDETVADYGDGADEELFCVPSQGNGAWLTTELIERQQKLSADCIVRWQWPVDYLAWGNSKQRQWMAERKAELDIMLKQLDPKHRHCLGFDFARVADLSVVLVDAITDNMVRDDVLVLEMRNVPHEEQFELTRHIWDQLPRPIGGAFDATGAGGYVAEGMARRFGSYDMKEEQGGMIAQVKFSQEFYREHMPKVKAAFEEGLTRIPKDASLLGDLRLVKVMRGIAQIPAVRDGVKGLKRHGDYAVAKLLCWYASLMNTAEYEYLTLGPRDSAHGDGFWKPPGDRLDERPDDYDEMRGALGAEIRGSL